MDGDRFDQFTRSLVRNVSRRSFVGGVSTLLAGAAVAVRPSTAKGAPNPCNVYCAGEPGSRGAQCRQACKDCGGPTSDGFCYDQLNRQYICCPGGQGCFEPFVDEGLHTAICCANERQVCRSSNEDYYCCPDGEVCSDFDLCCPEGTLSTCEGACCQNESGCCYSLAEGAYVCGDSCYDLCVGRYVCGEQNTDGSCAATACLDPCSGEFWCGDKDEQGNCEDRTCNDVCTGDTLCGTPNGRGNCLTFNSCYDPCTDVDMCGSHDDWGNCYDTTCYDPGQSMTICGADCWDYCGGFDRCGEVNNDYGYCDGSFCVVTGVGLGCGPADDDGACIE